MIHIQEIPIEKVDEFWNLHMQYLVDDEIISAEEDVEYFSGNEYRDTIVAHMKREEDKHHIIDKFYQSDSSHQEEGNGLGLALVKQILQVCNGEIMVENLSGGCRFTVVLYI